MESLSTKKEGMARIRKACVDAGESLYKTLMPNEEDHAALLIACCLRQASLLLESLGKLDAEGDRAAAVVLVRGIMERRFVIGALVKDTWKVLGQTQAKSLEETVKARDALLRLQGIKVELTEESMALEAVTGAASIAGLARAGGLEAVYETGYRILSRYTHAFFDMDEDMSGIGRLEELQMQSYEQFLEMCAYVANTFDRGMLDGLSTQLGLVRGGLYPVDQ